MTEAMMTVPSEALRFNLANPRVSSVSLIGCSSAVVTSAQRVTRLRLLEDDDFFRRT
jgi:hypothetical protein